MHNQGFNQLTNTLSGMMKQISDKPPNIDFGKINSDFSLSINSFSKPIPIDSYSVCRQLLYDPSVELTTTYVDGAHSHYSSVPTETHQHKVKLPKKMRRLKPGDKVLVAIVANEFVVIDIVFDAKYLNAKEPAWT